MTEETDTQAILEAASREACPNAAAMGVDACSPAQSGDPGCLLCQQLDPATRQLVSTGRKYPDLGRVCPCYEGDNTASECNICWKLSVGEHSQRCEYPACQGTGTIPDLSREACDATAERLGYPCSASLPNLLGEGYRHLYYKVDDPQLPPSVAGPTREAAAQAALAAVLRSLSP